jgi:DNA modification methylase
MCFTDPPYNVDYKGAAGKIKNDALGDAFGAFLQAACDNIVKHTAGACYVAMSSSELHTLHNAFVAAGGKWSTFIIWVKNTFTLGRSDYHRGYEPILFGNAGAAKESDSAPAEAVEGEVFKYRGEYQPILYGWPKDAGHTWQGGRSQSDVWKCDKPVKNPVHPTMKPVELVERAIRNSSKRDNIVLDLFGGSGSTLIAAEKAGRRAYLMELDTRFVDVIIQRWQNFTGQKAINKDTGLSYDDTRKLRKAD